MSVNCYPLWCPEKPKRQSDSESMRLRLWPTTEVSRLPRILPRSPCCMVKPENAFRKTTTTHPSHGGPAHRGSLLWCHERQPSISCMQGQCSSERGGSGSTQNEHCCCYAVQRFDTKASCSQLENTSNDSCLLDQNTKWTLNSCMSRASSLFFLFPLLLLHCQH